MFLPFGRAKRSGQLFLPFSIPFISLTGKCTNPPPPLPPASSRGKIIPRGKRKVFSWTLQKYIANLIFFQKPQILQTVLGSEEIEDRQSELVYSGRKRRERYLSAAAVLFLLSSFSSL